MRNKERLADADYFGTEQYKNRPGSIKLLIYRLIIGKINRKVANLRGTGLCGPCPDDMGRKL